jgi:phenylacetate-CoA ligase
MRFDMIAFIKGCYLRLSIPILLTTGLGLLANRYLPDGGWIMLIVKGVNFYPRQVEQALKEIPGVADEFQIILTEENGISDVRINVEAAPNVTGHMVAKHLRERLGFLPKGDVLPIGSLPRTEGKAKRVIREKINKDK